MTTFALALVAFLGSPAGDVPAAVDAQEIPNYRVLRSGLAGGGQPSAEGLARLKAMGFTTVVNLRTEKEGTAAEEAAVKAAGLRYVSVPVTADTLSAKDVDAVAAALGEPSSGPVLLHCASSNRVGAMWALLQLREGKSMEEALAAGQAGGLTSSTLVEAVKRVAATPR
jgi:uncharacterized protein (TIGR01244 family)